MKALIFQGIEKISYETVADPKIEHPKDVIVKVESCAICGSDLHPYHGKETGLDHGTVMGHEFCGEIVEKGKDVINFNKSDFVISPFTTNCGACYNCKMGLTARCEQSQLFGWIENQKGLQGGQAEFIRVPLADSTLLKIPENLDHKIALLSGDILSTGYYCALQADIKKGDTCVVIGCGPVGLMAVLCAKEMGAEKVIAIDHIPERLALAEKFGAISIDYTKDEPEDFLLSMNHNRLADSVLEAVGTSSAAKTAFDLLRPGGTISTVGVHTHEKFGFNPTQAYDKNITYKIGRCSARFFMHKSLQLATKHEKLLRSIFTHNMNLKDGVEAYKIFDHKFEGCIKVLMNP